MMNKLEWRTVTRNHWTATLPGTSVYIEVHRNRSWKALRDDRPFKLTILGQQFGWPDHETLDDAQHAAEEHAKTIVRKLARWAGAR
jgi:hypothetical protein